jgi:hypothetical protein
MRLLSFILAFSLVFALFLNSSVFAGFDLKKILNDWVGKKVAGFIYNPVQKCFTKPLNQMMRMVENKKVELVMWITQNVSRSGPFMCIIEAYWEIRDKTRSFISSIDDSYDAESTQVSDLLQSISTIVSELIRKNPLPDDFKKLVQDWQKKNYEYRQELSVDEEPSNEHVLRSLHELGELTLDYFGKKGGSVGRIVWVLKLFGSPISMFSRVTDLLNRYAFLIYGAFLIAFVYITYLILRIGFSITAAFLYVVFLPVRLFFWIVSSILSLIFGVSRKQAPKVAKKKFEKTKRSIKRFFGVDNLEEDSELDALVATSEESNANVDDIERDEADVDEDGSQGDDSNEPPPASLQSAKVNTNDAFMALTSSVAIAVFALFI